MVGIFPKLWQTFRRYKDVSQKQRIFVVTQDWMNYYNGVLSESRCAVAVDAYWPSAF